VGDPCWWEAWDPGPPGTPLNLALLVQTNCVIRTKSSVVALYTAEHGAGKLKAARSAGKVTCSIREESLAVDREDALQPIQFLLQYCTDLQGRPRSMIFIHVIWKPICHFLLVINSNLGRISHRFRDTVSFSVENARFPLQGLHSSPNFENVLFALDR